MNILRRGAVKTLLTVCTAALLTIAIGSQVKAAVPWGGHLWSYSTFRLDNSLAGGMAAYMTNAGNDYSNNTDLTMTSSYGALYEDLWYSSQGVSRTVAIDTGANIQWATAPAWPGSAGLNSLPGAGVLQSKANYRVGNNLIQAVWRNNQGWTRNVPIVNDAIQWENAPTVWTGPVGIDSMPGSGNMQAHGDYATSNTLIQAIWRNNQGYARNVPIVNGVVQWGAAQLWIGPIGIESLPGGQYGGDMQAQDNYVVGNTYWQTVWRNNIQSTRHAPVINGVVDFNQASAWVTTTAQEDLPGGVTVQAQGNYVLGWTGTNEVFLNGTIGAEERNFGPLAYYQAYTNPLNASGESCYKYGEPQTPTGNCNTTTQKATSVEIRFNTYYLASDRNYLARHEMGHAFGLFEAPCTNPPTVMYSPNSRCPDFPFQNLQADEIGWINNTY